MNSGAQFALLMTALGLAIDIAGAVIMRRSYSTPRVAVAAQLLGTRWLGSRTAYDVVYPDPWGRPLTATVTMSHILPPRFSGKVWVNPQVPTDVCARRWGPRGDLAVSLFVVAVPFLGIGLMTLLFQR